MGDLTGNVGATGQRDSKSRQVDSESRRALREEGRRALGLIDETQLSLFAVVPPLALADLAARIDAVSGHETQAKAARESVREILRETLRAYRDPYANYIDPRGHDAYARRRRGDLVGVGLKFRVFSDAYPRVLGVLLGGPLEGVDIHPGDQLKAVDGVDLRGAVSSAAREQLTGPEGSTAALSVQREGRDKPHRVDVTRRTVELHYARRERLAGGRIGYVRISRFGTDTHQRVATFVRAFARDKVAGIILDLRDNPGGSTRAARAVTSMFGDLPVVYCEQRRGAKVLELPREGDVVTDQPLVVLVNERSMSSAEIVAGALQLSARARIVGAPTWGKGLIQKVYPLQAPLGGAIRTTIATFATPDGVPIHARGIVPDVYVPSAPHGLFEETGSLNVSAASRDFRRGLLLDDLATRKSKAEAKALSLLPDIQREVAIATLLG